MGTNRENEHFTEQIGIQLHGENDRKKERMKLMNNIRMNDVCKCGSMPGCMCAACVSNTLRTSYSSREQMRGVRL